MNHDRGSLLLRWSRSWRGSLFCKAIGGRERSSETEVLEGIISVRNENPCGPIGSEEDFVHRNVSSVSPECNLSPPKSKELPLDFRVLISWLELMFNNGQTPLRSIPSQSSFSPALNNWPLLAICTKGPLSDHFELLSQKKKAQPTGSQQYASALAP